jgi:hypothetical protein
MSEIIHQRTPLTVRLMLQAYYLKSAGPLGQALASVSAADLSDDGAVEIGYFGRLRYVPLFSEMVPSNDPSDLPVA